MNSTAEKPVHFKGKDPSGHVAEAQLTGILAAAEVHGIEPSGEINAFADALRETSVLLVMLWFGLSHFASSAPHIIGICAIFSLGWFFWKIGRCSWLGWFRLERLHRLLAQERWEIQHHRPQEREELRVLYGAKGLEGKLLEDVLDVLMADNERLLKVMIEEEMGIPLESEVHPLKQGIGAGAGVAAASLFILLGIWFFPTWGIFPTAFVIMALGAGLTAHLGENRIIQAIIWNVGMGVLASGTLYFLLEFIKPSAAK